MSLFWSLYIAVPTLGTLVFVLWLVLANRRTPAADDTATGEAGQPLPHCFDGIEEHDNPLPRWWLVLFIATVVFALGYLLLYPGLGGWRGLMPGYAWLDAERQVPFANGQPGWSAVHQWEKQLAEAQAQYQPLYARFASLPLEAVAKDPQARQMGERLFATQCATCHGSDARGAFGYPNLTDDDWRWGGQPAQIEASILNGRRAVMPPWGKALSAQQIQQVSAYVVAGLGARALPAGPAIDLAAGQKTYATYCVACHGTEGQGNPLFGAPGLRQPASFIYGASLAQIEDSVRDGRQGQMPAQRDLLGNDRVRVLAAYLHGLSRQDEAAQPAPATVEPLR